jgi:putative DNA primase/helicase
MLAGDGRNGKGTLLRAILAILGKANTTSASLHDLLTVRFTTASLFGKLANISGDIDGTYLESTATLKGITGGDQLSAEHKMKDRFDFTPWCVPVFSANKIPASADTSAGYLSRWLVIPFPNSFEGREDRALDDKLRPELPGILAAGLRALPELLARGQFSLGDSALEAKADFARRVDQVRNWLHECCGPAQPDERGKYPLVNRAELFESYRNWVWADGGKPLKASEFYNRLAAAGVPAGADGVRGVRGFRGIKVVNGASATDLYRKWSL